MKTGSDAIALTVMLGWLRLCASDGCGGHSAVADHGSASRLAMHTLILIVFTIGAVLLFVLVINNLGQVLAALKSKEQYWDELLSS